MAPAFCRTLAIWHWLTPHLHPMQPFRVDSVPTKNPVGPLSSSSTHPALAFSGLFICGTWEFIQHVYVFRGRRRIFQINSVCHIDWTFSWLILSLRPTKSLSAFRLTGYIKADLSHLVTDRLSLNVNFTCVLSNLILIACFRCHVPLNPIIQYIYVFYLLQLCIPV